MFSHLSLHVSRTWGFRSFTWQKAIACVTLCVAEGNTLVGKDTCDVLLGCYPTWVWPILLVPSVSLLSGFYTTASYLSPLKPWASSSCGTIVSMALTELQFCFQAGFPNLPHCFYGFWLDTLTNYIFLLERTRILWSSQPMQSNIGSLNWYNISQSGHFVHSKCGISPLSQVPVSRVQ